MELHEKIRKFVEDQTDEVIGFRLSSGESVLALVENVDEVTIEVRKPILYAIQNGRLGFSSWICNGKTGETHFPISAVTIFHEVEESVREQYLEIIEEKQIKKVSSRVTKLVNEHGGELR